jgi:2-dehydropantoate 2-reductase
MKITVIGCGAMGSIYAALLASNGNEVHVVDGWQAHIDAINENGLRVEGASGDRTVRVSASTTVQSGAVDLVIIAVKGAQVEAVASQLTPLLGPHTVILTIQNGVGSADVLAEHLPPEQLAMGVAGGFGAIMRGPGHSFHNGMNVVRIGPYSNLSMAQIEQIVDIWRNAGFKVEAAADVLAMQWEKLICNAAYSAPCALTGMTVGEVKDDPDIGAVSRNAAVEAWRVAQALKIAIKIDEPVTLVRDFAAKMPNARPSLLQDHENRRRSEIDVINGAVCKAADRIGLEVPVNVTLTALIKHRERSFP